MTDTLQLRLRLCCFLLAIASINSLAQSFCDTLVDDRSLQLYLPMCEDSADYCLALPLVDLADFEIQDNGQLYNTPITACGPDDQLLLRLDTGFHQLIITNIPDNCFDTLDIQVHCFSSQITQEQVFVGQTAAFCLDTTDLMGNLRSFNNRCQQEIFVDFTLDLRTGCVVFFGLDEGLDTACIELCTDMGDCKSLLLIVESRFAPPFPLPQANDDLDTIPEGDRLIFNVSLNDTFDVSTDTLKLIESSQWGMLAEIGDGIFGYQGEDGFCGNDSFRYAICNPTGCDTATVQLNILCDELRVYSGFSPNGDGVNDAFRIDGLTLYPNNVLRVFNRWGNLVFEQQGYTNDWEGRWKGEELPDGTYFYVLELNNENQRRETGYVILHR